MFTAKQVTQLLQPVNERRVLADGKGHSHLSQQDVTAHLIRCFGFGGFDIEVLSCEPVFEDPRVNTSTGELTGRWDVCYRAMLRLTIRDPDGNVVCRFEDGSTGMAQNQTRGDGHDLAYKSAISLSKKRCAINLGDQFGLSLYNKGQTTALVMGTIVRPELEGEPDADVQEGVEQQVELGNDETPAPEPHDDGRMSRAQSREHNALVRDVLEQAPSGRRSKLAGPEGVRSNAEDPDDPFYVHPAKEATS